jgi:hypothetical protein
MRNKIKTICLTVTWNEWTIEDIKKYVPCDFTYYYNIINETNDFSKCMYGKIVDKDGVLFLEFEDEDMKVDIKVDSEEGREILMMCEM